MEDEGVTIGIDKSLKTLTDKLRDIEKTTTDATVKLSEKLVKELASDAAKSK